MWLVRGKKVAGVVRCKTPGNQWYIHHERVLGAVQDNGRISYNYGLLYHDASTPFTYPLELMCGNLTIELKL
jgi:hypothetical protein